MSSVLILALLAPTAEPAVTADAVYINGKVWTVDPAKPEAQAVAVWRGRILKVGTDAEVKPLAGPNTKVIDLKGRRVVPGFYDSHAHFLGGGQQLARVELKDAKDEAEFGQRLAEFDKKTPRDRWLVGGNWDHDRTFGGKAPDGRDDRQVREGPARLHPPLRRAHGARQLRGAQTRGHHRRDEGRGRRRHLPARGRQDASGVLRDNAMSLVGRLIPEPDDAEILEAVLAAQKHAAELGVTSVQDMDGSGSETRRKLFRVLQRLAREGKLTCRIDLRWPIGVHRGTCRGRA